MDGFSSRQKSITCLAGIVFALCACGGGGGSSSAVTTTTTTVNNNDNTQEYAIGGSTSGLTGTAVLQLNSGDEILAVAANGAFTFATALVDGDAYDVTILSQPSQQTCVISNGNGRVNAAHVTNITVTCVPDTYTVSGTITSVTNMTIDSDVNDPNAPYASNDAVAEAQTLGNPVVVGGFASAVGTGVAGARFGSIGDKFDWYSITTSAGQTINLYISDYANAAPTLVDLDLGLFDATGSTLLAVSQGTGDTESITVAAAGSYKIAVFAFSGVSTYSLTLGATPAAVTVGGLNASDDFVPGEVIVRFKDNVSAASAITGGLQAHATMLGLQGKAGGSGRPMLFGLPTGDARARALTKLGSAREHWWVKMTTKNLDSTLKDKIETMLAVKTLRARTDVATADLNYIRKPLATPNDPLYVYQWHYPLINLPQAWDITTGLSSVIVAVIDTGVFMTHPDLASNLTNTGYDFISNASNANDGDGIDSNPDDPGDSSIAGRSSWHGTHVAGTIAAVSNNSLGIAGVAWSSKVMPIRVLGTGGGTSYDIMQAVRYAAGLSNDSGTTPTTKADIINLSLGGSAFSQSEQDNYTAARNAGVVIIAAAGNENSDQLSYPASYDGVVSVSAVDMNRNKAPYSNYGQAIDVAAPGGDSSVDNNGDGYPDGVLSTLVNDASGVRQSKYDVSNGTSMAAPHVTGVAALMVAVRKAAGSSLTPAQFDAFLSNGSITNDLGNVGRDDIYGYGLIDALKAVQAASGTAPTTLVVNPSLVNLAIAGGASATRTLTVSKSGGGALTVTGVTPSASWLTASATGVDGAGLGTYTITASGANHA